MQADQAGERSYPKHTYANIKSPYISIFFALMSFLFSIGRTAESDRLFGDPKAIESRFSEWLHKVVQDNKKDITSRFGISPKDIGMSSSSYFIFYFKPFLCIFIICVRCALPA